MDVVFTPLDARALGAAVRDYLDAAGRQDRRPAWPHGNHDVTRAASRWGDEGSLAVLLFLLALPGATYLYAGDELGLPEVLLPDADLRDPTWWRSGHTERGRDGCRVPLPWTTSPDHAHGFVDPPLINGGSTWLPQPPGWGERSVAGTTGRPGVAARASAGGAGRAHATCRRRPWPEWLAEEDDLLVFRRGEVTCVLTTGDRPVPLAGWGGELLASSRAVDRHGRLPGPGTAWLREPGREMAASSVFV